MAAARERGHVWDLGTGLGPDPLMGLGGVWFVVLEEVALPLPPSSCSWGPGFVLGAGDVAQLGAAGALCG